jgi:rRNA-processing protein EBP2
MYLNAKLIQSPQFDLERIDDSDSSSDGEDNLTEAKLPTIQKTKPVNGKSKKQVAPIDEDEDEEEDEKDIPLSDIESLNSEDKGDVTPYQRLTINNVSALQAAHKRIALSVSTLPFSVHQSITTAEPVVIEDIDDDLNRELAFYSQSLSAVKEARKQLKAEGNAFTRPVDYFAEMVKSDEHMGRVKAKLVDEAAGKKAAAEARKQRDLKKFGKQVQVAKGQERDKAKRDTLEKIKVLKRSMSFLLQNIITIATNNLRQQNVATNSQPQHTNPTSST